MQGKKKKPPKIKKVILLISPFREYTRGLLRGIARYGHIQSDWAFHWPTDYRLGRTKQDVLSVLKKTKPDGILMRESKDIMKIIKLGIPTVSFTHSRDRFSGIGNAVIENEEVGKIAAEHLLKRGFERFAYCGFDGWWSSQGRERGFAKTVSDAGGETYSYKPSHDDSRISWDKELPTIADWLAGLPKPIGLMAHNDDCGQAVMEACKAVKLRIPEEVAIVGVDDDRLICNLSNPPMSSVALSIGKSGYDAAALLSRLMKGKKVEKTETYIRPIRVIERQSTNVLAIDDRDVVEAIRYIRNHTINAICVTDVLNAVPLSRRVLEKRFRKVLKHSIHDEIRHTRIEKITYLLSETQMSISQIAQTMEFPCVTHLSRYFREVKGIGPVAYRKLYI